jgi:hypothetical protein
MAEDICRVRFRVPLNGALAVESGLPYQPSPPMLLPTALVSNVLRGLLLDLGKATVVRSYVNAYEETLSPGHAG